MRCLLLTAQLLLTSARALHDPACGHDQHAPAIPPLHPSNAGPRPTLLQTHVLIRHGDRSGIHTVDCFPGNKFAIQCPLQFASVAVDVGAHSPGWSLPNVSRLYAKVYSNNEPAKGSCARGMLTRRGYDQEIANGAALREAYVAPGGVANLLPHKLNPATLKIVSDDIPR